MTTPLRLAFAALFLASPAFAQDRTAEIDRIFSWVAPGMPGCAVAVSHNGKVVVHRAYGLADLEHSIPITPATVFDAGSVVKQFVAASVLLLVEEGRVSLSDDIRTYIPELPDTGHKITIDHLLTHTSGVRDWTGIRPLAEGDPDALTLALRQRGLDFAPGEEWSYSNTGYVLLKELVARVSEMSFSDFTRKRLFEPLGMTSTTYLLDMTDVVRNRALAYDKEGDVWKQNMLFGNDRGGGGGLMSTPTDLLIWNDALTNGRLGKFVTEKIQEPATLNNGRKIGYARALFLDANRGGKVIWHTGSAAGYKTFLGRFPEQGLSTAIMCNAGDMVETTAYSRRIFDLFLPASVDVASAPSAARAANAGDDVVATPADLSSRAGLFFNERTGQPLRMIVNSGRLGIAGSGPLVAIGPDRFRNRNGALSFMSDAEIELQYVSADEFEIRTKEGETTRYRRAQPYAPTAAELNAFAGRYESNEMGSVLEIVPQEGGVVMRFYRNPAKALQFKPVDRDTFMFSRMVVRFVRDDDGNVVGYDYSNPIVRNIRFTRLSDGGSK